MIITRPTSWRLFLSRPSATIHGEMSVDHRGVSEAAHGFDSQAASFDRRAGLPRQAVRHIAAAVVEHCAPNTSSGVVLDLAAGTGEIGQEIAANGVGYLGLDVSLAMLRIFQRRQGEGGFLVQADASKPWPIQGGVRAILVSRAVHLLAADHVLAESSRLAGVHGIDLILGRVRRDRQSVRFAMRRRMRELLADRGITGRGGDGARVRLEALAARCGGAMRPARVAATWPVQECPAGSLAAWRSKSGLAGMAVSAEVQRDVLGCLESWAKQRYGDLHETRNSTECYELTTIRLHGGDSKGDA